MNYKERIKENGLSVTFMAKLIDCNRSKLSSYLNGNFPELWVEKINLLDTILNIYDDTVKKIKEVI